MNNEKNRSTRLNGLTRASSFNLQLIRTIKSHLFTALLLIFYFLPAHSSETYQFEDFKSQFGYFKQLTLGNYKKDPSRRIMKWTSDINIYLKDDLPPSWDTELNKVLEELNQLTNHVSLIRVTDEESANFFIFSQSLESYHQFEPLAQDSGTDVLSLSFTKENSNYELIHGSMLVRPLKFQVPAYRKYILRTQLASSLGIFNTSRKYYDSIFLDGSIGVYATEFSNLDKTIIKTLYDDCIKAGMDQVDLDDVLLNGC